MDVEIAHRPGAPGEPAEVRTKPPGDVRRKHALHLPEQGPRLAGRHPEIVQAFGVEVGLDAGLVHLQHRVEPCEQALARDVRALAGVEVGAARARHAAEGRIRAVGGRKHGLGRVGLDRLDLPEPADRAAGEPFVTAQRMHREPGRPAAPGEAFHHEHGLVLAIAASGDGQPAPGFGDHEQPPDVDQGREQRVQPGMGDVARIRRQGRARRLGEPRGAAESTEAQHPGAGKGHVLQHEAGAAQAPIEGVEVAHVRRLPRAGRHRELAEGGRDDPPHRETARRRERTGFGSRVVVGSWAHPRVIYRDLLSCS